MMSRFKAVPQASLRLHSCWQAGCGLLKTAVFGAMWLGAEPEQAAAAGLAQEFYVPMPENQLVNSFRGYYASAGNTIDSSISLTPMFPGIIIYYDHWEDGYEADLSNPQQSTTEIWGDGDPSNGHPPGHPSDILNANSVIRLRNLIDVPRNAAVLRYDGRDRIGVTKPAALTRMAWATNPGPVLAGAIQIQSTLEYGTDFVSPAGENAPNKAFNEIFERVEFCIMAAENGTQVQIDADANGVFESTVTLNRGESHAVAGVKMNARVLSSKPVQVHLITGDVGAQYESRWFNVFPRTSWGSEYFNPVCTTKAANPGCVFLFNPHAFDINVSFQTTNSGGSLVVPARGMTRHEMPQGSGTRYFTTGAVPAPFMALGAMDTVQSGTGNTSHEWGFTLIPRANLTAAIKLGYAPGAGDEPISGNGNPAWVIAEQATRLYVDYDGDLSTGPLTDPNGNKYDYHVDVPALASTRVYDPDRDQTGLRVYSLDGTRITAAWGQDPSVAAPGNPYLDMGYTVLPHPLFFAVKTGALIQDLNLDGVADRDDIIEYVITITNIGIVPVNGVTIRDLMEGDIHYNPGSTTLDEVPVPDDLVPPQQTVFPLDEDGYNIGTLGVKQTRVLKFTATVGHQEIDAAMIRNLVLISIVEQDRDEQAEEFTPTRPSSCETAVISSSPGTLPAVLAGQSYAAQFHAAGRDGPYVFSVGSGSLPPGLTLDAHGALSGTATTPGVYDFTVLVLDQYVCPSSAAFQIIVRYPMGVGNAVFLDADGNGRMDAGEGLPNVPVRLYRGDHTPGVDAPMATTLTGADGSYYFADLAEGGYYLHIPAEAFQPGGVLAGRIPIAHSPNGDDDAGSNGIFAGDPAVFGVSSNLVALAAGTAPTFATGETGFLSHTDDAIDSHVDLTIDFGFMRPVGLGNLVFIDSNDNGRADPGEGVAGVPVELYAAGQTPGADSPLAQTETAADGHYFFGNLPNGQYVAHIPARAFYPGSPLGGYAAIALGLSGDDDVGQNGIKAGEPEWEGVSSGVVSLALGSAPTFETGETGYRAADDDDYDAAVDLTIDFGFQRVLGVGNLVFVDANQNGVFDYGEGVAGVRMELYRADQTPGAEPPILVAYTDTDGVYLFDQLTPGSYRLFIPPVEFQFGRPLWRLTSLPGVQLGDDDQGEKGLDDPQPDLNGIMTAVFTLARGALPVDSGTETGGFNHIDNRNDADYDLTQDFGFAAPDPSKVGVGNLVFVDANGNGRADEGEGRGGVLIQLFNVLDDPQTAEPLAQMITNEAGTYLFSGLSSGAYFVHVPASQFQAGGPLAGLLSVPGAGGDWGLDDDYDENGIDSDEPWATGISSTIFYLSPATEPVNSWGESGHEAGMDDAADSNTDLTIDLGFSVPMGLGNLVFRDDNANGRADPGEGVAGVTLRLLPAGADPVFGIPLAETVTDALGRYLFDGLPPGGYVVHLPHSMFAPGAPLHGLVSLAGTQEGDDDQGEKGVDNEQPEFFGISSLPVVLLPGQAPAGAAESGMFGDSDDEFDANTDLTVDFGFGLPASVGDLVWHDVNGDGLRQPDGADGIPGTADDEIGLAGVRVELWSPGVDGAIGGGDDLLVREAVETGSEGAYSFIKLSPGKYYMVITAANFEPGGALEGLPVASPARSSLDDGVDDDNNGAQPGGRATAAFSPLITLSAGENDMTVDFGFLANLQPLSWPEWQLRHGALGDTSPGGNSDGDMHGNLAEFAFGLNPRSGLMTRQPLRLHIDPATHQVDVSVDRVTDIAGLSYDLEVIADLLQSPQGWQKVEGIAPVVTHRADGTEEARYAAVSSLPGLAARGQVRVKLSLDSDLNGEPEAVAYSKVLGWSRLVLGTHLQTLGQGHALQTRLSGRVGAVNGSALDLSGSLGEEDLREALVTGGQHYVEILDGAHAGHRLEVNEASSQGGSLVIDGADTRNTLATVPATLAGARLVLRRHVTLDELAPKNLFRATTNAATADRLMIYDPATAAFRSYWLLAYPGAPRWVLQGDASLSNRGGLVLEPGLGLFVQPRTWQVTLMLGGEVRDHPFASPLPVGMSLRSAGWPLDLSPAQLGMTEANGFTGASNASLADQMQIWRGDTTAGLQSYDGYYFLRASTLRQWVAQGDSKLTNLNHSPLIKAHRSLFFRARHALPVWVQPCPWTP